MRDDELQTNKQGTRENTAQTTYGKAAVRVNFGTNRRGANPGSKTHIRRGADEGSSIVKALIVRRIEKFVLIPNDCILVLKN